MERNKAYEGFFRWIQAKIDRGTSLGEMALRAKISKSIISLWMHGKRSPDLETADKLCKAYGASIFDLVNIREIIDMSYYPPELRNKFIQAISEWEKNHKSS